MFGPTIGGFLFDIGGFALPFWASGGFSLLLAVASIFLLKVRLVQSGSEIEMLLKTDLLCHENNA